MPARAKPALRGENRVGEPGVSLKKAIWDRCTWQLPSQAVGLQLSEKAKMQGGTEQPECMAALSDSAEPGSCKACWGRARVVQGMLGQFSVHP